MRRGLARSWCGLTVDRLRLLASAITRLHPGITREVAAHDGFKETQSHLRQKRC